MYLRDQESWKGKLRPMIIQVPDGVIGQRGPEQWVELSQNCYQPAVRRETGFQV